MFTACRLGLDGWLHRCFEVRGTQVGELDIAHSQLDDDDLCLTCIFGLCTHLPFIISNKLIIIPSTGNGRGGGGGGNGSDFHTNRVEWLVHGVSNVC